MISPSDVVERMKTLALLAERGEVEYLVRKAAADSTGSVPADMRVSDIISRIPTHLESDPESLTGKMTEEEAEYLNAGIGTWSEAMVVSAGWLAESLGVLGWALGSFRGIRPYDRQFPLDEALEAARAEDRRIAEGSSGERRLVRESDVERERDIAEIWYVRSLIEEARRRDEPPVGGASFDAIRASLVDESFRLGAGPVDAEDFRFLARPYEEITTEALSYAQSIAYERYRTLCWLTKQGPKPTLEGIHDSRQPR